MAATAKSKLNAFLQCNLIRVHQLKWALWCNGPLMMAVIVTGDHQTWFPSQPCSVSISFMGGVLNDDLHYNKLLLVLTVTLNFPHITALISWLDDMAVHQSAMLLPDTRGRQTLGPGTFIEMLGIN